MSHANDTIETAFLKADNLKPIAATGGTDQPDESYSKLEKEAER